MRWNMRAERARCGLSEREVAKRLGCHANQVSRWENGLAMPSGENLIKLSRLYGCKPDYLLDNSVERYG